MSLFHYFTILLFHYFTISLFHYFTISLFHYFTISLFHYFTISLFHYFTTSAPVGFTDWSSCDRRSRPVGACCTLHRARGCPCALWSCQRDNPIDCETSDTRTSHLTFALVAIPTQGCVRPVLSMQRVGSCAELRPWSGHPGGQCHVLPVR